jgi:zinc protease
MRRFVGGLTACLSVAASLAPRPSRAQSDGHPDRPVPGPVPVLHFPRAVTRRLPNGVRVVVLEDHALPVVDVTLVMDLADVFDPTGKEGLGGFAGGMLGEGTTTRTADQLAEEKAALGNGVSAFGFTTVTGNVDASLALMSDQLLHPAFPAPSLERIRANAIAGVQRASQSPGYVAGRVFGTTVYGAGHPYASHATAASLASITRDDVVAYYAMYYRPKNATFLVAGDVTADSAVAMLSRAFKGWKGGGKAGRARVRVPPGPGLTRIYVVDRPGSAQSTMLVGGLGPRRDTPDYAALQLVSTVLGGAFNSRINLDLREAHGWTYGAHAGFAFRAAPEVGTFEASTEVATPKTDSALAAMMGEIAGVRGVKPVTDSELTFAKRAMTLGLPLRMETIEQVAGATAGLIEDGLPLDYYDHVVQRFTAVTVPDAHRAAARDLDPSHLAIVIVGDRAKIEAGLRASHVAPVVMVNEKGEAIAPAGGA